MHLLDTAAPTHSGELLRQTLGLICLGFQDNLAARETLVSNKRSSDAGCQINPNLSMSTYSPLTAQPTYWAGIFLDTGVIQSKCIMGIPLCAHLYSCKAFPSRKYAEINNSKPCSWSFLKSIKLGLRRKSNESFVFTLTAEKKKAPAYLKYNSRVNKKVISFNLSLGFCYTAKLGREWNGRR